MPRISTNVSPRGTETRQRLLEAGLVVFSQYGYAGASTRLLAEHAQVNLSAIPYYFGGKEGLYHAVVAYMSEVIVAPMHSHLVRLEAMHHNNMLPSSEARRLLYELLDAFATVIVAEEAHTMVLIYMREQIEPTPAFEHIYTKVMAPLIKLCAFFIGRILNQPPDSPDCTMRAFLILGQILIFRITRAAVLRSLGEQQLTETHIAWVRSLVHQHLDYGLHPPPAANT
jgi:TetR/AcrR family transcriptional regulator, regulator of cefoperazone and chloramphenicol sensitivity